MRAAATDAAANSAAARPLPQPSLLQPTDPPQEYEQLALLLESITLSAARYVACVCSVFRRACAPTWCHAHAPPLSVLTGLVSLWAT